MHIPARVTVARQDDDRGGEGVGGADTVLGGNARSTWISSSENMTSGAILG